MDIILFTLAGIIAGGLLVWFGYAGNQKRILENRIQELQQELDNQKEKRIKAEASKEALEKSNNENNRWLKEQFNTLANDVLQKNSQSFINLANQVFEKHLNKAEDNFKSGRQAMDGMIKPLKESLDNHEKMIKEFQETNNKTFGSLKNYLENLQNAQKELEKETGALVSALKNPRVRGRWGEIGLKRIVEFSGLNEYCDFTEQMTAKEEGQSFRPDLVVHLPDEHQIVVDSKVPLNNYLSALEAEDEQTRQYYMDRHTKDVEKHMKALGAKSYWQQFSDSVDFVVLYVEVESAFGAALSNHHNLVNEGIKNRVIFATPTTLVTLLQTVAYTWKQFKATENAKEIWKSGSELYERAVNFSGHLNKLSNSLTTLVNNFNNAVGSWESRLIPGFKKMEDLGLKSEGKNLNSIDKVEKKTRNVYDNDTETNDNQDNPDK